MNHQKYGDLKAYYDDWINYEVVDGKLIGGENW